MNGEISFSEGVETAGILITIVALLFLILPSLLSGVGRVLFGSGEKHVREEIRRQVDERADSAARRRAYSAAIDDFVGGDQRGKGPQPEDYSLS